MTFWKRSAWIAADNPAAAQALRDTATGGARRIGAHPDIGAHRPDLAGRRYRFLTLPGFPYVLICDCESRPPIIARVLHGVRDLAGLLRDLPPTA
ncbi:type II toxin-antitoxin system RelE/ParE family toxin [Inquilinus ginsengisoli]|uniref:type II toxin-antitoxin system RelE/ParE family toxin n=1 Tax=Inquilinus ginsengisoli TaxID=363840 RepID=UPI003D19CAE2